MSRAEPMGDRRRFFAYVGQRKWLTPRQIRRLNHKGNKAVRRARERAEREANP